MKEQRYYLYKYRKKNYINYPCSMVQIISKKDTHWLVTEDELENREVDLFDLEIHGDLLTHKDCLDIIDSHMLAVNEQ